VDIIQSVFSLFPATTTPDRGIALAFLCSNSISGGPVIQDIAGCGDGYRFVFKKSRLLQFERFLQLLTAEIVLHWEVAE